jgi:ketosteroid isomerase-like protein
MTRHSQWAVALVGTVLVTCGVLAAQGAGDADAVKALELERFQAMEKNDFGALDRLLADDLVYTHSSGVADSKAAYIDALKSGKTRYLKIVPGDLKVRALGDAILIHGRGVFTLETNTGGQKGENTFTLSFLDAWQKRNGKWQMIAWQSTRLPPTP